MLQRGNRDGHGELGAAHHDLRLAGDGPHTVGLADEVIEVLDHVGGKKFLQRSPRGESWQWLRGAWPRIVWRKQSQQRVVSAGDAPVRIEREHSGGDALQDRLDLLAAL